MAREAGGTYEDTEGLINLPLTVKEIQSVVFFKQTEGDEYRVSMRSKGDIDIGAVAKEFHGGGHKNAAGCTVTGGIDALQTALRREDHRGAIQHGQSQPAAEPEGSTRLVEASTAAPFVLSSAFGFILVIAHGRSARRRQAGRADLARRRRAGATRAR